MKIFAQSGSKTDRRKVRSDIRHYLGTSREGVPSLRQTLRAARLMDRMLRLTTNGVYSLTINKQVNGSITIPGLDEMKEDATNYSVDS